MKNSLLLVISIFITSSLLIYFSFLIVLKNNNEKLNKIQVMKIGKIPESNNLKQFHHHLMLKQRSELISGRKSNIPLSPNENEFNNVESTKNKDNALNSGYEEGGEIPEREKRREEFKSDNPDLFAKFERDIRTRYGKTAPDYPVNYRIKELLKSRHITSTKTLGKALSTKSLNWVERGPGNVSGRTRAIIVDPDDPNHATWFVGAVGGGIWKTTNSGQSWTNLTPDIPDLAISDMAMSASNHNVIYAATGEGFFNVDAINGTGIWKTTSKGSNWEQLPSTAYNKQMQDITRIIVDPSNENIVLFSAVSAEYQYVNRENAPHSGIFRSSDGGTSWQMVYDAETSRVEQIVSNPLNFNTQYATVNAVFDSASDESGVIKSLDGGLTWKDASNGIGEVARMELAVAPSDTSTIYFSAQGKNDESILYASNDGAANWSTIPDLKGYNPPWLGNQGWYDNTIAVDPYDKNTVYVGGINLWRFDKVDSAYTVTGVDLENTSSFLSFINWGGSFLYGAGGTGAEFWGVSTAVDSDFVSVEIRFGPGKSQKAYRFTYDGSVFNYQDYIDVPFEVWDITNNRQIQVSFLDWFNDGVFDLVPYDMNNLQNEYISINAVPYSSSPNPYIAQTNGMIYKNIFAIWPILTNGATWDPNNLPASILRINWGKLTDRFVDNVLTDAYNQFGGSIDADSVHPDHHNITLIKTNEAAKSFRLVNGNDGGVSFSDNKGLTFNQPKNGYNTTQFYGVDKMNGADRYIGGTQDNGSWLSGLNPDNKSSWSRSSYGDGFESVWNYNDPNKILRSLYTNYIYKTTDGGMSWFYAAEPNGLTDVGNNAPFITKLAKSKQDPDMVFAVGASGVWRSDDFASSWTLTSIDSNFAGNSSFAQVKMSLVNPQIVWSGSGMSSKRKIFVSIDGGLTFFPTENYTDVPLGRTSGLETDPIKDSTAYALFSFAKSPKILKTTDLGQSWNDISGFGKDTISSNGFPDVAVYSLLVMPYNPDIIWAGTEIGIYQTTDGGGSWAYADNGFPATAVWEMVIVNDEVVVATHGRGIWTVKIPELSGYEPQAITKSPRLNPIFQAGRNLIIPVTLRSSYDSSHIIINGKIETRIAYNPLIKDSTYIYPIVITRNDSVQIFSYKNGKVYKSAKRISNDKALMQARNTYSNEFDTPGNSDFAGNGFVIDTAAGFSNGAIQSQHPYPDYSTSIYQLLVPIIVSSSNATITYRDVALVEPGEPDSVFGSTYFYDYVVVEGSKDGLKWLPLADGYDANKDSSWFNRFASGGNGDSTLFRQEEINILNTFSAGDTILIRFRLFADEYVNGWGWAIDNLVIQGTAVSVKDNTIPTTYDLSQNYPNPFNPTTTIKFQIPHQGKVLLEIYNILGEKVKTLINDVKSPGFYQVIWNGTNDNNINVASGIYIYRLVTDKFISSKKMVFLK